MPAADMLRLAVVYSFFYFGVCQLVSTPPPTGLYFMVGDNIYLPGQTVLLSVIVNTTQIIGRGPEYAEHAVVCVTTNVNTACCRNRDGGNVGEWYHPDGTIVIRRRNANLHSIFSRSGYTRQVRLNYLRHVAGSLGVYSCKVPDGQTGTIVSANITITDSLINVTLTSPQDSATAEGVFIFTCFASVITNSEVVNHYEWRGPNNSVITSATQDFSISTGMLTSMLSISLVKPAHAGRYTCTAIGSVDQQSASKVLYVKLKAPVLLVLTVPPPPIYVGSSLMLSCHFQITRSIDTQAYFHVEWAVPARSFVELPVSAIRRTSHTTNIHLSHLTESDSGNYTCSVYLSSTYPYVIKSDVIQDTAGLDVQARPSISVMINESAPAIPGQHHTLTCCPSSSDENLQYFPSYIWRHNGATIAGITSKHLFLVLTLSDSGNYTCEITAHSNSLGSPLVNTSEVHQLSLQIPSPSLMVTSIPYQVFAGSSPNLTCSILFTEGVDVSLIVKVKWMGPTQPCVECAVRMGSLIDYTSTIPLIDVADSDGGSYTCTVTATHASDFLSAIPPVTSTPFNLVIVGPPSSPTNFIAISQATSIFLSWNQPLGDFVALYIISFIYTIKDCNGEGGSSNVTVGGDFRAHTLGGVEENSDFTIVIRARNDAGGSGKAVTTTATLTAAPSSGPTLLTVTSVTSATISISWGPVLCVDRNAKITGYIVSHSSNFLAGASTLLVERNRTFTATGLYPVTYYVLGVTPLYGSDARAPVETRVAVVTRVPEVLGFFLGGSRYSNNTVLALRDIGEGSRALFCLTNLTNCCRQYESPFSMRKGHWKMPDNSYLTPHTGPTFGVYRNRRASAVLLHRNSAVKGSTGVYTCEVPDANGMNQVLYVLISQGFSVLRIKELDYQRESLTLTCISVGRPVNQVSWLKDDSMIRKDSPIFSQSQVIIDATSVTYLHTLSSGNVTNFEGRFACIVRDASGGSVNRTVALNNCPAGDYGALTSAGSVVCIACPMNSISTSVGRTVCGCLQGYYRNPLEDPNFPCTRPPSACRNLRILDTRLAIFHGRMKWLQESTNAAPGTTTTLRWERPIVTGREDVYYNIYHSDPDFPDNFVRHNPYPLTWDSALLQYRLSGLRPLTKYVVRVTVHNGVSIQDPGNEAGRRCELTWTTPDIYIGAPRSVTALCNIIVWQVPTALADARLHSGYDILFSTTSTNHTVIVSKNRDQLFHLVKETNLPDNDQKEHTIIKVRAKIATTNGTWSSTISLNCSPGNNMPFLCT